MGVLNIVSRFSIHRVRANLGARFSMTSALRTISIVMGLIALLAVLGCYNNNTGETTIGGDIKFKLPAFPETGSNKVQVFTEMHYQPSYRAQEGPRLLSADGAVPITGAEVLLSTGDEYAALQNPGGDSVNGGALYALNCLVCHGERLDGKGVVTGYEAPLMNPANLLGEATAERTDGELYGIISFGGSVGYTTRLAALASGGDPDNCVTGGLCPMPEFRKLLDEGERWDLVAYMRQQQGQ